MKKILIIFTAVLLTAALAACQPDKNGDNDASDGGASELKPDITGEILEVQNETALRVLVDSTSDSITGEIWVTVTEDTKFVDAQGAEVQPEDIESLFEAGETAAFLSDGIIMESYPMQTSAEAAFIE